MPLRRFPSAPVALLALVSTCLVGFQCRIALLPLPPVVSTDPAPGGLVASSHWIRVEFQDPADVATARFATFLRCDSGGVPALFSHPSAREMIVQPVGLLPPGESCLLVLATVDGTVEVPFSTAGPAAAVLATYDRTDRNQPLPFPDDAFLVPDAGRPTGWRPDVVVPDRSVAVAGLLGAMAAVAAASSDGWSPIGPLVVHLSGAPLAASLPLTPEASLDPLSTLQLLDLTPGSPTAGQRVPFLLTVRADAVNGPVSNDMVVFPSIPLEPGGRYGLVVTNRVLGASGAPLSRSAFFQAALDPPTGGEAPEVSTVRPLAAEVLAAAASLAPVAIPAEDVALAVRVSVRTTDAFVDDLLAMREDVLATPPNVQVTNVDPYLGDTAAVVSGTFDVPVWRSGPFVSRDAGGDPQAIGVESLPFVLALPDAAAAEGGVPIVMYQHGNPGSAEAEVPNASLGFLAGAGFAVGGFTDVQNRTFPDVETQSLAIFAVVLATGDVPDFYLQTYSEQMAFLRALQSLGSLDVLPLGAPDGVPDLDPDSIVYEGISNGSNHGQAFLAYAPDVRGAGLVAGATRLAELLEYQDRTLPTGGDPFLTVLLPPFVQGVTPVDVWMGLGLFAVVYDRQDPHNHARFVYREPVSVGGTTQKASILVAEGIGDSFVMNNATRSLAYQLGAPQLEPPAVAASYLASAAPPLVGNVDATTSAALQQFVPLGVPGLTATPGCGFEGHYCAQSAPAARAQRAAFYRSAVEDAVPVIGEAVLP